MGLARMELFVDQAVLELVVNLLPQTLECWDCRCKLLCPAFHTVTMNPSAHSASGLRPLCHVAVLGNSRCLKRVSFPPLQPLKRMNLSEPLGARKGGGWV